MVEVIILDDVNPAELMVRRPGGFGDDEEVILSLQESRTLYDPLGACLGALDAETHPKNPERK